MRRRKSQLRRKRKVYRSWLACLPSSAGDRLKSICETISLTLRHPLLTAVFKCVRPHQQVSPPLGDGYTEKLREVYGELPDSCDLVMYWWDKAAELARRGDIKRFGLIATNSLRQTFNRRVLQRHLDGKPPLALRFAIPDHPWVDAADGAAVRISMTIGAAGEDEGLLQKVVAEGLP